MRAAYAQAKTVYQELRAALTPWAKSHGFRRWSGTQAGWRKAIHAAQILGFKFEGYSMVDPDVGNSLTGLVQLDPSSSPGATPIRQAPFSCCLVGAELDQLARIEGAINQRRPPLPEYLEKDAREDSLLGHYLRTLYQVVPEYREGEVVELAYHSIDDVRDLARFISAVLPAALDRFLEGRVAQPIDTTPPHLRPKWL